MSMFAKELFRKSRKFKIYNYKNATGFKSELSIYNYINALLELAFISWIPKILPSKHFLRLCFSSHTLL